MKWSASNRDTERARGETMERERARVRARGGEKVGGGRERDSKRKKSRWDGRALVVGQTLTARQIERDRETQTGKTEAE